jgi:hypothetical protein
MGAESSLCFHSLILRLLARIVLGVAGVTVTWAVWPALVR